MKEKWIVPLTLGHVAFCCVVCGVAGCVATEQGADSMSPDVLTSIVTASQSLFDFAASFARNALAAFLS